MNNYVFIENGNTLRKIGSARVAETGVSTTSQITLYRNVNTAHRLDSGKFAN